MVATALGLSVTQYDLVLAAIAVPLVIAWVAATVLPVALGTAMAAGSLPATGGLGYALFLDPPETGS